MILVNGHLEMTDAGPLGSAILGDVQNCYFASGFETVRLAGGRLAITKIFFRHL